MEEEWRIVPSLGSMYEASNLGRVRSWLNGRYGNRRQEPKVLKKNFVAGDYEIVSIQPGQKYVAWLVLEAFVGPKPEGTEVLHGPGGPRDNSLSNLYYGTRSQNNKEDKRRDGTDNRGEKHPLSLLTDAQALEIHRLANSGVKQRVLMDEFNVSQPVVSRIKTGGCRQHLFPVS